MEQVLPFLDRRRNGPIPKSPKWTGVQSYRAVGGGMHIRETREPAFYEKRSDNSNCRYSVTCPPSLRGGSA